MGIIDKLQEWLALYGLNVLGALAILVLGWLVARLIRTIVARLMTRAKLEAALVSFVSSLSYAGLLAFVIIASLGKLGVQTASFVAVLAAAGLAIGLALQGSLANFAAGFLIVLFKPFKVGDYVEGGGAAGVVERIEIFTTTMRTVDNKKIIIPNARMTGDNIINYSANPTRRVDLVFGVSYGDDLQKVHDTLMEVVQSDPRVLGDPAPVVAVVELADSSVNFVARPWVKTEHYWDVYFEMTKAVKQRFDAEGISIPFPQRDVHIHQAATRTS